MDKLFFSKFELSESEKEKWEGHRMIDELFEKGLEINRQVPGTAILNELF